MGASAAFIIQERVVPTLGVILFIVMSASPTRTVWRTRKKGDLGEFNPLPSAVLVGNAVSWNVYSAVTHDPFICISSTAGLLIAIFNTVIIVGQASQRTRDRLLLLLLAYALSLTVLGGMTSLATLPPSTVKRMWGVAANTGSILYYTSPFSTILKVIKTKSSASIHWGNCLMSVINCMLWITYFVSKGDLVVPTNTYYIGTLLNVACLLLCWRYPRHVSTPGGPPGATHADGSTHALELVGADAPAAAPPAGLCLGGAPHPRRPTPSGTPVREGGGVSQWLSELRARGGAAGGGGGSGAHTEGMREVGEQPRAAAGSAATRGGAALSLGGTLEMPGAPTHPLPAPNTSQEGGGMVEGEGAGHGTGGGQQQAAAGSLERRSGRGACDYV